MAGELPTPLDMDTPAKVEKQDPRCPESIPAVPATATANWSKWSTLPDDLVRRIAKCFLYTNDVDYYMCFRAVCPSWRAVTGDPKRDALDSGALLLLLPAATLDGPGRRLPERRHADGSGAALEVRGRRWSGFVLHGGSVKMSSHA
ncbi:uncharacterized protein [Aegilops tauschii subsp. strangulata]|uniref:uncharacterized protein n=1 Tax=Aegilops tauschii subsp. strangulata TaxID=200361 RepID=UPI00098A199D|nr:uncharacterized protein LOC109762912 [Aegilops tauschii subsp. strangulata]XP_044354010.1 uncharacterized protein LOC123075479 [Triticum aestivum]